ncbi:MAG TPA: hypothetical protein VK541_14760 [Pedobacter sp.]|uniref:hypothetical protein n=1 Tax=Pedobacter sp. TaxID=1411316 RepID=UPI002CDAC38D|nr:hypothetical protein [Pedobacter sp.]HMI03742.1 hypothetical protein [Pedobacter sp.]
MYWRTEMMIKELFSFGIFMLIENTIILVLLADLAWRLSVKLRLIRHPHVYWRSGIIFLAYVLCMFVYNLSEFYTGFVNYLLNNKTIAVETVAARVFGRSLMLIAIVLLWYYSVRGGYNLFKDK